MATFDVPGWTVPAKPVAEDQPTRSSKKRKRPSIDTERIHSAEVNLGQLVKKIKDAATGRDGKGGKGSVFGSPGASKSKRVEGKRKGGTEDRKATISLPKPLRPVDRSSSSPQSTKRLEFKHDRKESTSTSNSIFGRKSTDFESGLTALQQGMKHSLDGARFRIINETLYKSESHTSYDMMRNNPKVFEEYHIGFRHQVQGWPTNPVEHYITILSAYPPKTCIVDLGCGDAALAKALVPKGMIVISYDLISDGSYIVEADVCNKIPLPGSEGIVGEKTFGEGHITDVVVCALSLMGTNWLNCIREAWRVLVPNGELKIAEVASRFTSIDDFHSLIISMGFKLISTNNDNTHFTLFEFRKVARRSKTEKDWAKVIAKGSILKACEYKRR